MTATIHALPAPVTLPDRPAPQVTTEYLEGELSRVLEAMEAARTAALREMGRHPAGSAWEDSLAEFPSLRGRLPEHLR